MSDLTERKERLLKLIIEYYIRTAEPVGSKFLAENTDLGLSGATLRNEMRDLETEGYLTHPHTSAGRIPTEVGYKYYIGNIMKPVSPKKRVQNEIEAIRKAEDENKARVKNLAKYLSSYMGGAVIVSFADDTLYYTGLSNLFSQPEFRNYAETVGMSAVFDECERYMFELLQQMKANEPSVVIGTSNPLGDSCGTVMLKIGGNVIAVVGPMRMSYRKTIGILEFIRELQ